MGKCIIFSNETIFDYFRQVTFLQWLIQLCFSFIYMFGSNVLTWNLMYSRRSAEFRYFCPEGIPAVFRCTRWNSRGWNCTFRLLMSIKSHVSHTFWRGNTMLRKECPLPRAPPWIQHCSTKNNSETQTNTILIYKLNIFTKSMRSNSNYNIIFLPKKQIKIQRNLQ